MSDRDVELLRRTVQCKLNLEMSLAVGIVDVALSTKPDQATIVPEKREEVTTEGGIDLLREPDRVASVVQQLNAAGIVTSAFIDPDERQVAVAQQQGFAAVELHTGEYANAADEEARVEQFHRLEKAGEWVRERGMWLHAGHGLNYRNVGPVARITNMRELNIGHAIVSRAVFVGLREAVREMKHVMNAATLAGDVRWAEAEAAHERGRTRQGTAGSGDYRRGKGHA